MADLSDVTATGTYPVAATVYLNASDEVGPVGTYTINVNVRNADRRGLTGRKTFGGETLEPICTGEKRLKEDVVQISLLRQTECGLKESCGGNCCRLRTAAPGGCWLRPAIPSACSPGSG